MTTTPTLWGTDVTFSFDPSAFNPKVAALSDGTFAIAWENGTDLFGRHLNELGSFTGGNFLQTLSANTTKAITARRSSSRPTAAWSSNTGCNTRPPTPTSTGIPPISTAFLPPATRSDRELRLTTSSCKTPRRWRQAARRSPISITAPAATNLVIRFVDALGNQASNQIFVDPSGTRARVEPGAREARHQRQRHGCL